jgi:hypothetical protein
MEKNWTVSHVELRVFSWWNKFTPSAGKLLLIPFDN